MSVKRAGLAMGLLLAIVALPGQATVIYTYAGPSFTVASGTIDTNDFVTAALSFDAALPVSLLTLTDVSSRAGFALTLSAGPLTISDSSPNVDDLRAEVTTDASGQIATWNMTLVWLPTSTTTSFIQTAHFPGFNIDRVVDEQTIGAPRGTFVGNGGIGGPGGNWSFTVPETPTTALALLGIALVAFDLKRRERRRAAIA